MKKRSIKVKILMIFIFMFTFCFNMRINALSETPRSIEITFEDNIYNSFENNTLTLEENINNGYVTIPEFNSVVNITSDKYIKKVDDETYYFNNDDGYSYTFTGWKIKGSSKYNPSTTVFQPNGIIDYDVLNVNSNGKLELEAVWGKVIYVSNEYTGRLYTKYWIYNKEETLKKVADGTYQKTGAWNYKYENDKLTLNKGKDIDNPISSLDYAYYLIKSDTREDLKNAYLNVIMLTGDLDYIKGSSGSNGQTHYFNTKYDDYSKLSSLTDNGDTLSILDSEYDSSKYYIWGDYTLQRNIWGSVNNSYQIGATFKSVGNNKYNFIWNGHGYSDVMYGNIRFDNVTFGGVKINDLTKLVFEEGEEKKSPISSSSETAFNGGKGNYIEFTRRTVYNNQSTYVFRPGATETVVLNGFRFSTWQTSWQGTIADSDYEIKWYMGGNAHISHLNMGTTSSYDTASNIINKKITFTMTGGTVDGNIYGGSNARGTIDKQDRVINLIGDPTTSSVTTNPYVAGHIFGGSYASKLYGNSTINIKGCTNLKGSVYGGGYLFTATIYGSTNVNISNSVILGNVFGGGYNGNVDKDSNGLGGNTNLSIYNSSINGNIYGVGMGGTQSVSSSVNAGFSDTVYGWKANIFSPLDEHFVGQNNKNINYADYNTSWDWTVPALGFPFMVSNPNSDQYGYVCSSIIKYNTWTSNSSDQLTFGRTRIFNYLSLAYARGDVNININKSTIGTSTNNKGNIYGGGSVAVVHGDVHLKINDSSVYGNIYGGGDGTTKPQGIILYEPLKQEGYVPPKYTYTNGSVTGESESVRSLKSLGTFNWSNDKNLLNNDPVGFDFNRKLVYSPNTEGLGKIDGNVTVIINNSTMYKDIYGGGNAGVIGDENNQNSLITVEVNGGSAKGNLYAGGNSADIYGSTDLTIKNATINGNVFGGGNSGNIGKNTKVKVTDGIIKKSLYAGGNSADVYGNTDLTVDGNSKISIAVFGGGNSGAIGKETTNNSSSLVKIAGGSIGDNSITNNSILGNVYGGCNTSVVYGETSVKIGTSAINDETLTSSDINILGTVFGGGEANSSGSSTYDFSFISVTKGTDIVIDGSNHSKFDINGSIFGSGNASSTSGSSSIQILNYGTKSDVKQNVSIQRANTVLLKNSYIDLSGTVDSTNRYATELFTISRIDDFKIQDSYIFLQNGTNLLKKWESLSNDGSKANIDNNSNRIYIKSGNNMKVTTSEDASTFGDVLGITFMGIYDIKSGTRKMGIYNYSGVDDGAVLSGVFVVGAKTTDYNIDGFVSNYLVDGAIQKNQIVNPLSSGLSYVWRVGSNRIVHTYTLKASSFSTVGKYQEAPLFDSAPATEYTIQNVDYSKLAPGVKIVNSSDIKKVADSATKANNEIGLSFKVKTDNGWSTSGSFDLDSSLGYTGMSSFITEYTTRKPSLEIYLENSANFTRTDSFGRVTLDLYGIKQDEIRYEIYEVTINIIIEPATVSSQEYEASITEGKQYSAFGTTSTIINHNSSLSALFSLTTNRDLFSDTTKLNRVLISDYAFPRNTKIVLLDISDKTKPLEYYYIVDGTSTETKYNFNNFIKMGYTNSREKFDNTKTYYNNGVYNEQFIVTVDFSSVSESDMSTTYENTHYLLMELENGTENSIGVENGLIPSMKYNVQHGEVNFNLDGTEISSSSTNPIPTIKSSEDIGINIVVNKEATGYDDTNLANKAMGIKLNILKQNNSGTYEVLKKNKLLNKTLTIDNNTYYPDMNGNYYIKLNDDVVSVSKMLNINNSSLNLESGHYKIQIDYMDSYSGLSNGEVLASKTLEFDVQDVSYGLKVDVDDKARIFIQNTGNDMLGNDFITFNIKYTSSGLDNPNIRLKVLKKNIGSTNYVDYDLNDIFTNNYTKKNESEYLLFDNINGNKILNLNYKDTIGVGSYKFIFTLYDENKYIGEYPIQIIVKEKSADNTI